MATQKKEIIVVVNEGYSASSRKNKRTISNTVDQIKTRYKNIYDLKMKEFHSSKIKSRDKIKQFILSSIAKNGNVKDCNVFLIGKSFGCYELYKIWKDMYKVFRNCNKISTLFVDGHSPFPTFYGSLRSWKIKKKWKKNGKFFNIFQQNHYPKGADMKNADDCVFIRKNSVDHFNIISHRETKNMIDRGFGFFGL